MTLTVGANCVSFACFMLAAVSKQQLDMAAAAAAHAAAAGYLPSLQAGLDLETWARIQLHFCGDRSSCRGMGAGACFDVFHCIN